ncbi:hypothetical protein V2J09_005674 [Rumex salicifolius]
MQCNYHKSRQIETEFCTHRLNSSEEVFNSHSFSSIHHSFVLLYRESWGKQSIMASFFVQSGVHINPSSSLNSRSIERHSLFTHKSFFACSSATLNPQVNLQVRASKEATATDYLATDNIKWPSPNDPIPFWNQDFPLSDAGTHIPVDMHTDNNSLHIIHVTAEMAPIAKVGGLGDVVSGLASACISRGHSVQVMLPFYECIPKKQLTELALLCTFNSYHDGDWVTTNAYSAKACGIPVILIEPSNHFFKGKTIYGGSYNELEAYLFFSRACLEWMQLSGTQPDIIHVHEWQTSALPLLYWDMYHKLSLKKPRLVLTIHNMEHQGECRQEQLNKTGLDGEIYAVPEKAVDDRTIGHNPERLSLLKGGIVYSNSVVTVSPTYLKETLCSGWLSSTLINNQEKYMGILNGIDISVWNPETDIFLPARFNANDIAGKLICKEFIQKGLGLETINTENAPLVVCITRLVPQKGLHLISHAIKHVQKLGGQMVLLGTASDPRFQRDFKSLADEHNEGPNIRILLMYSEELSHMLYAASDMVLIPSIYEPCGLAQMIGMRYGAVPIVRKTGGLADTVFDVDNHSNNELSNGFVFEGIDENSLNQALDRAFSYYNEKPDEWMKLVKKNMQVDNSWNKTAGNYINIYNSVKAR